MLLIAVVAAAPADASLRRVATGAGPVATDDRVAAYQVNQRTLRVQRATGSSVEAVPGGCVFRDIVYPRVLFDCLDGGGRQYPLIRRIDNDAEWKPPPFGPPESPYLGDVFYELGRYWLRGFANHPKAGLIPAYLEWRRGLERVPNDGMTRNLDSPDLAPLRPCNGRFRGRFVSYAAPWVVFWSRGALYLRRCGGLRRRLVVCRPQCEQTTLTTRAVAWTQGNIVVLYRIRSRRRTIYRFSDFDARRSGYALRPALTRAELFVSEYRPRGEPAPLGFRIHRTSIGS